MDDNTLIIKYNIGWNGKPCSTNDSHPKGTMQIYLNRAFQTYMTSTKKEKCLDVVQRRKLMKFIIQAGIEENIEQFHNWLKGNSILWLVEFEKLGDGRW